MKSSRMIALVLVLGVFFSLAGCGKSEESKPKEGSTPQEQQARKDKKGDE